MLSGSMVIAKSRIDEMKIIQKAFEISIQIRYNKMYSVWRFCVNPVAEQPRAFFWRNRVRNGKMSENFIGKSCSRNA